MMGSNVRKMAAVLRYADVHGLPIYQNVEGRSLLKWRRQAENMQPQTWSKSGWASQLGNKNWV
jgi:hypothetical protein